MLRKTVFIVLAPLAMQACSPPSGTTVVQTGSEAPDFVSQRLMGNWAWVESYSSWMDRTITPVTSDSVVSLVFGPNGEYSELRAGNVILMSNYRLLPGFDKDWHRPAVLLALEASVFFDSCEPLQEQAIHVLTDDTLRVEGASHDACSHLFVRRAADARHRSTGSQQR